MVVQCAHLVGLGRSPAVCLVLHHLPGRPLALAAGGHCLWCWVLAVSRQLQDRQWVAVLLRRRARLWRALAAATRVWFGSCAAGMWLHRVRCMGLAAMAVRYAQRLSGDVPVFSSHLGHAGRCRAASAWAVAQYRLDWGHQLCLLSAALPAADRVCIDLRPSGSCTRGLLSALGDAALPAVARAHEPGLPPVDRTAGATLVAQQSSGRCPSTGQASRCLIPKAHGAHVVEVAWACPWRAS